METLLPCDLTSLSMKRREVKDRGAHVKDHQAKVKRICIVCDQTFKKQ